jgi:hypothetical protein
MMKLFIIILFIGCTKPNQVDVYSNGKALWDYCHHKTEVYDNEPKYVETVDMDIKCDSVRFFQIICSRTGKRELIIYKYKRK